MQESKGDAKKPGAQCAKLRGQMKFSPSCCPIGRQSSGMKPLKKYHDETECKCRQSDCKTGECEIEPHVQFLKRQKSGDNKDDKAKQPSVDVLQIIIHKFRMIMFLRHSSTI